MERMFRAMVARDEDTFCRGLVLLHAGEVGRMSCVLQLSKIARSVRQLRGALGSRFTEEESETLWQRFVHGVREEAA